MIRWLIRRDLPQVLEICRENHSDLDEDTITSLLRKRYYIGLVDERYDNIVGFTIYYLDKESYVIYYMLCRREFLINRMIRKFRRKLSSQRNSIQFIMRDNYEIASQLKNLGFRFENGIMYDTSLNS